ncbi:hypothetical protein MSPP1_001280 [Malassezia sp. CBS 17886]|nr:hypothetical protein MSPP1_001280 [Malassezia sp. CBS 17886]
MPHLEIKVGPDRFHLEPCRVNDTERPHEIDTEHFCGRVLVRVLDAPGAREGEPGREYFIDRSRRFCIQIEGRFKREWSGDEILFGTDFDKFVPFPRAPFNAGMRVARMIDPCTFYEEHPPSGRPYVMSPYAACMNVLCAWPCPARVGNAVVVNHPSPHDPHLQQDPVIVPNRDDSDVVPVERIEYHTRSPDAGPERKHSWLPSLSRKSSAREERVTDSYWRFIGFRDDPRVREYMEQHHGEAEPRIAKPGAVVGVATPVSSQTLPPTLPGATPVSGQTLPPGPPGATPVSGQTLPPGPPVATPVPSQTLPPPPLTASSPTAPTAEQLTSSVQPAPKPSLAKPHPVHASSRASRMPMRLWHGIDKNTLVSLGSSKKHGGIAVDRTHSDRPDTPKLPSLDEQMLSELHTQGQHYPSSTAAPPVPLAAPKPLAAPVAAPGAPQPRAAPVAAPGAPQPLAAPVAAAGAANPLADPAGVPVAVPPGSPANVTDSMRNMTLSPGFYHGADATPAVEQQLGPWRFADPSSDMVEDNAFIFTSTSVPVPRRRKHFAEEKNRVDFKYNPDIVYGASFFSNLFDFNTFDLSIGPVRMNVSAFFKDMPIRYSLRAAGPEELTFCTISFQLVD